MKKAKTIFILAYTVGLLLGCTGEPYQQVLDKAAQQNAAYDSITGINRNPKFVTMVKVVTFNIKKVIINSRLSSEGILCL